MPAFASEDRLSVELTGHAVATAGSDFQGIAISDGQGGVLLH